MDLDFIELDDQSVVLIQGEDSFLVIERDEPVLMLSLGQQGPAGQGLPGGGSTGQILVKLSNTAQDAGWEDPPNSAVWGLIEGTLTDQADLVAFVQDQIATSASRSVSFAFAAAHG